MSINKINIKIYYLLLFVFAIEALVFFGKNTINGPIKLQVQSSTPKISLTTTKAKNTSYQFPILIYHYVENVKDKRDTIRKSLNIPPNIFEAQIKTLKENGYIFITPSEMEEIRKGRLAINGKPIILSFDDGYGDFYTDIFPILKKYHIKAVAYIVPGFLDKLNYMSWNQVKEVEQSGFVEIGAHTMHHLALKGLSEDTAQNEIVDSKRVLELSLGRPITSFAYPYGSYSNQTADIAKLSGFQNALTTNSGVNNNLSNQYLLQRIHPGTRIGKDLILYIENPGVKIASIAKNQVRLTTK